MGRSTEDLLAALSPERRAKIEARAAELIAEAKSKRAFGKIVAGLKDETTAPTTEEAS